MSFEFDFVKKEEFCLAAKKAGITRDQSEILWKLRADAVYDAKAKALDAIDERAKDKKIRFEKKCLLWGKRFAVGVVFFCAGLLTSALIS